MFGSFPAVLMPALHEYSEPRKVKIDFSASMTGSNAPGGSSSGSYAPRPGHDGLRDVGSGANNNRVLLLRGLNYYSTPAEIIARLGQEIARLVGNTARPAQGEKTICRLVLMLDKNARTSWGYGFVELATHQLAAALLAFLISPQTQPEGFQIFDFAVAATFANAGAFVPVPSGPLGSELVVHASRHGGIGGDTIDQADGSFVGYWHPDAIPQETVPIGAPKIDDKGAVEPLNGEMKAFLGILSGSTDPDTAESSGQASRQSNVPNSAGPISISLGGAANKIGGKGKRVEETGFVVMEQKNLLGGDDEETDQVGQDTVLLSRGTPPHLQSFETRLTLRYSQRGCQHHWTEYEEGEDWLDYPLTLPMDILILLPVVQIAKDISKWNNKKDELLKPVEPDWSKPPGGLSDANAAIGVPRSQNRTVTPFILHMLDDQMLTHTFLVIYSHQNRKSKMISTTPTPQASRVQARWLAYCASVNSRRRMRSRSTSRCRIYTRLAHLSWKSPELAYWPWVQGHTEILLTSCLIFPLYPLIDMHTLCANHLESDLLVMLKPPSCGLLSPL